MSASLLPAPVSLFVSVWRRVSAFIAERAIPVRPHLRRDTAGIITAERARPVQLPCPVILRSARTAASIQYLNPQHPPSCLEP